MTERKIQIGTYDTATNGWTLNAFSLGRAQAVESYAKVPGRSGHLDLSTVLTDGEPYYDNRTFTARLESSEGTRLEREERINDMINKLDGYRLDIILPDDPTHYITGRVSVTKEFNDLAHAAVTVKANCDPWRYAVSETVVSITGANPTYEMPVELVNEGRMSVIPTIKVSGQGVITLSREGWSRVLMSGTYILPDLYLQTGSMQLKYTGSSGVKLTFTYREAVL